MDDLEKFLAIAKKANNSKASYPPRFWKDRAEEIDKIRKEHIERLIRESF